MLICRCGMVHLSAETQDRSSTAGTGRAFKAKRSLCEDNLPVVPEYAKSSLPAERVPVSVFPTTKEKVADGMGEDFSDWTAACCSSTFTSSTRGCHLQTEQ